MLVLEKTKDLARKPMRTTDPQRPTKSDKIAQILMREERAVLECGTRCFLDVEQYSKPSTDSGIKGRIQGFLKQYGWLYYALVSLIGPAWGDARTRRMRRRMVSKYGDADVILNLGSGPTVVMGRHDIINVDLFPFKEVDIVADAADLPMKSESVDLAINIAMLEHVPDPAAIVDEMHRVLKHDGEFLCFVPLMAPYHAAPHDYHRWTVPGAELLFSKFDEVKTFVSPGPTSGMLWTFQEWLAVLLSFGSPKIHDVLLLLIMVLTFPIKFLDELLCRHPNAHTVALGFFVTGTKNSSPQ